MDGCFGDQAIAQAGAAGRSRCREGDRWLIGLAHDRSGDEGLIRIEPERAGVARSDSPTSMVRFH
jgi:hypothetical protein